ncbi:MAG: hypothetical protein AAF604_07430 [Acidobacteriota bacterium]
MIPSSARRWFFGYRADLDLADPWVVGRLLEEGDGRDLQALLQRLGPNGLAGWWHDHRGRGLSRRSKAFWRLLLEAPEADETAGDAAGEELWPL